VISGPHLPSSSDSPNDVPSSRVPDGNSHEAFNAAPREASRGNPLATRRRIAVATRAGGLPKLPEGFDAPNGDWRTIGADNLFEQLYLDADQADRITTALVEQHYKLLSDFWNQKISAMGWGPNSQQIAEKYGDGQPQRVRTYPHRLEEAYRRLKAPEDIERELTAHGARRRARAEASIEELVRAVLVDGILEPAEASIVLAQGELAGLTGTEVREFLFARLQAGGFQPLSNRQRSTNPFAEAWRVPGPTGVPTTPAPKGTRPISAVGGLLALGAIPVAVWLGFAFLTRPKSSNSAPPPTTVHALAGPSNGLNASGGGSSGVVPPLTHRPPPAAGSYGRPKAPPERSPVAPAPEPGDRGASSDERRPEQSTIPVVYTGRASDSMMQNLTWIWEPQGGAWSGTIGASDRSGIVYSGPVSATLDGSHLTFSITAKPPAGTNPCSISIEGTASIAEPDLTGEYHGASTCAGQFVNGTFSLSRTGPVAH
jgi:hypothetical protein